LKFSFKFQETDTLVQTISLATTTVKKRNGLPMFLQTEFRGQRTDAEKVLAIKLKLYAKNEKTNLYDDEVIINNAYAYNNFSTYDYNVHGMGEKNYANDLCNLIHLPNDSNKPDRMNRLTIDHELTLEGKYPKEIKVVITVKWIGGEKEFSIFLALEEYYPRGIRTNPFG
jgi:hypothetical protein